MVVFLKYVTHRYPAKTKFEFWLHRGAYLGEITPMASAEIAPLSKHMTPTFFITITSAKKIMILPAFVFLWITFNKSYKLIFINYFI